MGIFVDRTALFLAIRTQDVSRLPRRTPEYDLISLYMGKISCKAMKYVEAGIAEESNPCITLAREADGSYILKATITYRFPGHNPNDASDTEILESYGFVGERRFTMTFDNERGDCRAALTEHLVVHLDDPTPVQAGTGALDCIEDG